MCVENKDLTLTASMWIEIWIKLSVYWRSASVDVVANTLPPDEGCVDEQSSSGGHCLCLVPSTGFSAARFSMVSAEDPGPVPAAVQVEAVAPAVISFVLAWQNTINTIPACPVPAAAARARPPEGGQHRWSTALARAAARSASALAAAMQTAAATRPPHRRHTGP